jgi:hypothetical protein
MISNRKDSDSIFTGAFNEIESIAIRKPLSQFLIRFARKVKRNRFETPEYKSAQEKAQEIMKDNSVRLDISKRFLKRLRPRMFTREIEIAIVKSVTSGQEKWYASELLPTFEDYLFVYSIAALNLWLSHSREINRIISKQTKEIKHTTEMITKIETKQRFYAGIYEEKKVIENGGLNMPLKRVHKGKWWNILLGRLSEKMQTKAARSYLKSPGFSQLESYAIKVISNISFQTCLCNYLQTQGFDKTFQEELEFKTKKFMISTDLLSLLKLDEEIFEIELKALVVERLSNYGIENYCASLLGVE